MERKDNPDKGTFISEEELRPELTEDNCTPELWKELTSNDDLNFTKAQPDHPE